MKKILPKYDNTSDAARREETIADSGLDSTEVKKNGVSIVEINENHCDQRVDNFLLTKFKNIPKSHIYKLLRKGEVRVNKKRVKPTYRLQIGDLVRLPPVRDFDQGQGEMARISKPGLSAMQFLSGRVIHEDDSLLVLNKPAGMAVHGGSGINFGVIETLRAAYPELHYLELVHRLDKGTSGCLLLAKKRSMLRQLHQLLREGNLGKKYYLLVKGKWLLGRKKVDEPLSKNRLQSGERVVKISGQGKQAVTIFRPLQVFADASLLEAEIHTGKTHQIRVHAAFLGHPIAGDDKYGDDEFNKLLNKSCGLKRVFLHAKQLKFCLPNTEKVFEFNTNLDEELNLVLEKLKK